MADDRSSADRLKRVDRHNTADRPSSCVGSDRQGHSRARAKRAKRPLLGAFPLTVMAVATFLVVFAILAARLHNGADPALRAAGGAPAVTRVRGGALNGPVVTRASRMAGAATAMPAGQAMNGRGHVSTPVLTRASGAGSAAGAEGDDA